MAVTTPCKKVDQPRKELTVEMSPKQVHLRYTYNYAVGRTEVQLPGLYSST